MHIVDPAAPVYVAGHRGLVGSAVWRYLQAQGYRNLIGWSSSELDLRDRSTTVDAVLEARPAVVVMATAEVCGILADCPHPVEFLNDNVRIQTNLFEAAHAADVDRLLFLGSSCSYPKHATPPLPESAPLTDPPEPANDAHLIARTSGLIAVKTYRRHYGRHWISAMPTNLYGPGDSFDLTSTHVLPAMIREFHEAKASGGPVVLWGTGSPVREFLHVDDLASAVLYLLQHYDEESTVNVGTGEDVTIAELAETVADVVGYRGEVVWDCAETDAAPRKLLDVSRLRALGWKPSIDLRAGIAGTYDWFLRNAA